MGVTVPGHGREDRFNRCDDPIPTAPVAPVPPGLRGRRRHRSAPSSPSVAGRAPTRGRRPRPRPPTRSNLALRFDPNSYALSGVAAAPGGVGAQQPRRAARRPAGRARRSSSTRDGQPVGDPIATAAHDDGVPVAYFPVRTTFADPGTYALTTTIGGATVSSPLKVVRSRHVDAGPAGPAAAGGGHADDRRRPGGRPICTRKPEICPFHTSTWRRPSRRAAPRCCSSPPRSSARSGCAGRCSTCSWRTRTATPTLTMIHAEVYVNLEGDLGAHDPDGRRPRPHLRAVAVLRRPRRHRARAPRHRLRPHRDHRRPRRPRRLTRPGPVRAGDPGLEPGPGPDAPRPAPRQGAGRSAGVGAPRWGAVRLGRRRAQVRRRRWFS